MKKIVLLSLSFLLVTIGMAQTKKASGGLGIKVSGTSTMHDWTMTANGGGSATANFVMNGKTVTDITSATFSVPVKNLKSTKGNAMDNNAYKALKTSTISYALKSASVSGNTINTVGNLTIAGKTLSQNIPLKYTVGADNSVRITGSKSISMKEFGMTPPTFMMGAVKTGDKVTVSFDFTLK